MPVPARRVDRRFTMPLSCDEIGTLVTRMQADFLQNPGLRLTLDEAERRFHVDRLTCEAVLGALTEGRVLTRDATGRYRRRLPSGNHVSVGHRVMATPYAAA
jgi:hypothetical protein